MYATLADMLARFDEAELVQLTDEANTGAIDQARVAVALADAATRIDGYVAVKYRAGAPVPLLTTIACALARHALYRKAPPEVVVDAQKEALATLRDIAKGVIKLDAGEEALPARDGAILVERPDRVFGRERLSGY